MIHFTTSNTKDDLSGILSLQKANLPEVLSKDEIISQGFVTVMHNYDELNNLNEIENHIVAKDGNNVIAYLLAMTKQSKYKIHILIPMFEIFDSIFFEGKLISLYNYIVVGQVCIAKQYRAQGIIDNCYAFYKDHFKSKYDFAITEIASTNLRSVNAHKRVGFKEIHSYVSNNTEWSIVLWDWKTNS